jgi:uncharacterized protein (UPF0333 family)
MWYNTATGKRFSKGQAMLEYILAMAGVLVVAAAMWHVVRAAEKQAVRTESLISSEYP